MCFDTYCSETNECIILVQLVPSLLLGGTKVKLKFSSSGTDNTKYLIISVRHAKSLSNYQQLKYRD